MTKKILIVEDDELQRSILRNNLSQKGFITLEAADGADGLDIALHQHPDVILTDVRMPNLDGMAMIHKLRQDDWGKKASIIILTNYDNTDEQLAQIVVDHPSYYLIKVNNSLEDISEKIQAVLENAELN